MPSPCAKNLGTSPYVRRHNPFIYTDDTLNNNCATHDIAYPGAVAFKAALDAPTGAPDFVFVAPNLCDDMHGSGSPCTVTQGSDAAVTAGDTWLKSNIDPIFTGSWFTGSAPATVIITMDEGPAGANGYQSTRGGSVPIVIVSNNAVGKGGQTLSGDETNILASIDSAYGPAFANLGSTANLNAWFGS
jgi:hypothetical protein